MKGQVAIVGAGYVGLPLAEVFAGAGNRVVLVETNPEKVELVTRFDPHRPADWRWQQACGAAGSDEPPRRGRDPDWLVDAVDFLVGSRGSPDCFVASRLLPPAVIGAAGRTVASAKSSFAGRPSISSEKMPAVPPRPSTAIL